MELWDKQDFSSFSSPLGRTISPKDGQVDIVTANVAIQGGKNEGFNGSVSSGLSLATFTEQNSSNMETSVTENLILDCVSQQGDGEDMNFVLVQSSNACEETRVVKSPEPVQYNSPSSTANPGAQSMSLSQASTPTKIHQPRPLYFTSDMFPRTSLLSPFVPPLPLKTKSGDSPSAENPSFISNTDYLPPFRKQRSLPTTITSAMDKAKSSGTKCRPMPRVASFPACQESVVIGRPIADSIVSDLRSASGATRFRVGRRMFASGSTPPPTQKISASSLSTPPPNISRLRQMSARNLTSQMHLEYHPYPKPRPHFYPQAYSPQPTSATFCSEMLEINGTLHGRNTPRNDLERIDPSGTDVRTNNVFNHGLGPLHPRYRSTATNSNQYIGEDMFVEAATNRCKPWKAMETRFPVEASNCDAYASGFGRDRRSVATAPATMSTSVFPLENYTTGPEFSQHFRFRNILSSWFTCLV